MAESDPHAAIQLLWNQQLCDELRRMAAKQLGQEKPGQTLQPTALVNEAYLRLVGKGDKPHWDCRGHFFAAAAEAMRRILVDNARRKQAVKHGGGQPHKKLDDVPDHEQPAAPELGEDVLALNEALDKLAAKDPRSRPPSEQPSCWRPGSRTKQLCSV